MKPRDIFLASIVKEKTPRAAVGSATSVVTTDLMEKVDAFFPEVHLDGSTMATLAAAGHEELGLDNVMPLFSVWHECAALGCKVNLGDKYRMPDSHGSLISDINEDINFSSNFLTKPSCVAPLKAISLLKKRFQDEVAVIGKVFGPWTLAYHIYGVQEFLMATLTDPDAVKRILHKLKVITITFAKAQLDAGADALTLADHCTRDLCSPDAYRDFIQDIHSEFHESIPAKLILHICGDTSDRIGYISSTGIECFHFDSKVPSSEARKLAGSKLSLMGGTSNLEIILNGNKKMIVEDVAEKIRNNVDILGPECAVPLNASYKKLQLFAEESKKQSLINAKQRN
ncbi:MAG TPA: uroporphyrinogen decarboxylase family protein [Victivallales bacterium]|nr:uroporphyrinogen decarboxylase family protein [Victivallales bacterium]